jgi:RNA methyltransferase
VEAAEQSERLFVPHFVTFEDGSKKTTIDDDADDRSGENDTLSGRTRGKKRDTNNGKADTTTSMETTALTDFLDWWSRDAATTSHHHAVHILVCRERSSTTLPVWHALERVYQDRNDISTTAAPIISVAFLIGPEGGWSPQENERMDELACKHPELFWNVSLGPNILRAETAAMTAVAAFALFQDTARRKENAHETEL